MFTADELLPKIPSGWWQRILGAVLLVLGFLFIFVGPSMGSTATALLNTGTALFIWGSIMGWLRVLEDRQIAIQESIGEMEHAQLQRGLGR